MSVAFPVHHKSAITEMRVLCGVLAAIVVIDAASVRAPFLAMLALPFLAGAVAYRHGSGPATVALALFAALYVAVGAAYAAGTGLDAGWGDLLFAYAGTPVAAFLGVLAVRTLVARHHA